MFKSLIKIIIFLAKQNLILYLSVIVICTYDFTLRFALNMNNPILLIDSFQQREETSLERQLIPIVQDSVMEIPVRRAQIK